MEDPAEPPLVPRAEAPPKVVKAVLFGEECPIGISIMGLRIIGLSVWIAMGEVRDMAGCCTGLDWLNLVVARSRSCGTCMALRCP